MEKLTYAKRKDYDWQMRKKTSKIPFLPLFCEETLTCPTPGSKQGTSNTASLSVVIKPGTQNLQCL